MEEFQEQYGRGGLTVQDIRSDARKVSYRVTIS